MSLQVLGAKVEEKPIGVFQWWLGVCNASGLHEPIRGWFVCNFTAVSRTQWAQLFAEIGTTYGPGDGSTTFNLPPGVDGRAPIPAGPSVFGWGGQGGERVHTLSAGEEPVHAHNYIDRFGPQVGTGPYGQRQESQNTHGGDRTDTMTVPEGHSGGAAAAHQNMPPVQVVGGLLIRAY